MARIFRFYEKKRGDRRTGSSKLGSFGEAFAFAVFLSVGCAAFAWTMSTLVVPEWRVNRHFAEATCLVLDKQVGKTASDQGITYRPEVAIAYEVEGRKYQVTTFDITGLYFSDRDKAQASIDQFEVGKEYPCWYDPMNPGRAVVVRGYSIWTYMLLLIPLSFMTIGGGRLLYTLIHWGSSAERRAALTQRAARIDLFELAPDSGQAFPFIPDDANLTNSPGTTLAYRLPIGSVPGWTLFAALMACLAWNAIVSIFVGMAISRHFRGEPDWRLTIFTLPLVAIGLGLLVYLIRQLLITTGVGATRVEISHHPLFPGKQYEVLVSQAGRLTMNSLELALVCEEKATYRQGTDMRSEQQRIFEQVLFRRELFEIHQALPFENKCTLMVPASAMHSFKADHNEINWRLVVRGNVEGWPVYERAFPVVIYPGDEGLSA